MPSKAPFHEVPLNTQEDQPDALTLPVPKVAKPVSMRLAQQMTIAGSFLDFALFVADVEHLKFILDAGKDSIKYYTLLIVLLGASLFLQLVVVFLMFIVSFKNPKPDPPPTETRDSNSNPTTSSGDSNLLNNIIMGLVTLIAIINVFITVFGDRSSTTLISHYKDEMERLRHHNASTISSLYLD